MKVVPGDNLFNAKQEVTLQFFTILSVNSLYSSYAGLVFIPDRDNFFLFSHQKTPAGAHRTCFRCSSVNLTLVVKGPEREAVNSNICYSV